jgi:hypothetical protein
LNFKGETAMGEGVTNGPRDNSFRGVGYKTLAGIAQQPESLRSEIMASGHPDVGRFMTEEQAEVARQNIARATGTKISNVSASTSVGDIFARGKIVLHKPTGHKVTIIRAYAGKDKESGSKLHEVVSNKSGKKFLAKEHNLKPVRE